mmetsp:Transcript_1307/g.3767  ORF Transcript_1307/g.3767 Transcript_1307/m.3767 type:complete len:215 (+) Transcript_1307:231-875(+)
MVCNHNNHGRQGRAKRQGGTALVSPSACCIRNGCAPIPSHPSRRPRPMPPSGPGPATWSIRRGIESDASRRNCWTRRGPGRVGPWSASSFREDPTRRRFILGWRNILLGSSSATCRAALRSRRQLCRLCRYTFAQPSRWNVDSRDWRERNPESVRTKGRSETRMTKMMASTNSKITMSSLLVAKAQMQPEIASVARMQTELVHWKVMTMNGMMV